MSSTHVWRCRLCGAPLPAAAPDVFRVTCEYCDTENRLVSAQAEAAHEAAARMQRAAAESEAISREASEKAKVLEEKMVAAVGEQDFATAARYLEGMMRMHYAGTVHLYMNGMDPAQAEAPLRQIDEAVATAVRDFKAQHGVA